MNNLTRQHPPDDGERGEGGHPGLSPFPYSDGRYVYFTDPDAPIAARGHMPFANHRAVAEWDKPIAANVRRAA